MKLVTLILAVTILTMLMAAGIFASLLIPGLWPCAVVIAGVGIWLQSELLDAISRTVDKAAR